MKRQQALKPVYIRGTALNCALGADREACLAALRARRNNIAHVVLDVFDEPLGLAYYRIADDADLLDPERIERLLPPVIEAAIAEAGLTAAECTDLPIFIGSSCLSVTREEATYARQLAGGRESNTTWMSAGYDVLADIARDAAGSSGDLYTWNTACTSAANALLAAQRRLALGDYRYALVVGVEVANLTTLGGFSALQLMADMVRPFDAQREGIVLGEGIGAVVLSSDSGAASVARLAGGASNCDTHSVTGANPDGTLIAAVQTRALQSAGISREQIRALKAHGTGTPANDAAEAIGMHQVFPKLPPLCALKPWLGHTMGACAINELILFAGALAQGFLPSTQGFKNIDPALRVAPLITEPAAELAAQPGYYLLNQFGFGGNNTALILEWESNSFRPAQYETAPGDQRGESRFSPVETASRYPRGKPRGVCRSSSYLKQAMLLGSSHYLQQLQNDAPLAPLEPELNKVCRKTFRRVDRFIQLALLGSGRCVQNQSLDPDCGVYLGSSMGPLTSNILVQQQMIRGRVLPKPFNFVNTLGNIAGFYVNDNLQLSGSSVFVSHSGHCLQALLATALSDLALGAVTQALVGVVEQAALPLAEHRRRLRVAHDSPIAEGSHWLLLSPITQRQDRPTLTLRRYADSDELSAWMSAETIDSPICLNHNSNLAAAREAFHGHNNVISSADLPLPRHASPEAAWFVGAGHDAEEGGPWPTLIDGDPNGAGHLLQLRP